MKRTLTIADYFNYLNNIELSRGEINFLNNIFNLTKNENVSREEFFWKLFLFNDNLNNFKRYKKNIDEKLFLKIEKTCYNNKLNKFFGGK